jgi:hypothetical protein
MMMEAAGSEFMAKQYLRGHVLLSGAIALLRHHPRQRLNALGFAKRRNKAIAPYGPLLAFARPSNNTVPAEVKAMQAMIQGFKAKNASKKLATSAAASPR